MSFPIHPDNGRIIVKPLKRPNTVKVKGLYVGEIADLDFGEVVAVDPSTKYQPGMIVGHPKQAGIGQYANGEIYLWLNSADVWGTWDKKEWEKLSSENE
jgi:hypothetical protein